MMHKAWSGIEEVPYCFSRSYIKFQGHTALKIAEFDPNWAFPDCNSNLNSPMAMKCCTKLETAKERCPIVFQGHPSNFKVTRYKISPIWPILADTAKLTGPRTFADKRWVGPVKLLCIIMFNISRIRPKSLLGPVKAQKFSRCLYWAFPDYRPVAAFKSLRFALFPIFWTFSYLSFFSPIPPIFPIFHGVFFVKK